MELNPDGPVHVYVTPLAGLAVNVFVLLDTRQPIPMVEDEVTFGDSGAFEPTTTIVWVEPELQPVTGSVTVTVYIPF